MKAIITIVTLLTVILISGSVFARPNRVAQVPNGSRFSCDICHTPAGGLNDFGFDSYDATTNGNVVWAELADLDSDRDGYTNGMELGDPTGSWRTGNANPGGAITDPSNKTDNGCGNGTLDAGEECDGSSLGGDTCNSLGLGEGSLRCTNTCTYDVGSCGSCGDNIAQPAEECDGTDMADATCEALGYSGGSVSCNSSCGVDISACDGAPSGFSVCGDSIITGAEICDSIDLAGETCQSLGFDGGSLGCSTSCGFDTSGCFGGFADRATPEDAKADNLGGDGTQAQALAETDGPDNQFEMTGHACSVAGVSNQATSAPIIILGFMMLGFGIRRRA